MAYRGESNDRGRYRCHQGRNKNHIEVELDLGFQAEKPVPVDSEELGDVYKPYVRSAASVVIDNSFTDYRYDGSDNRDAVKFIGAISEALDMSMQQHPNLVLMGQDIAEYGGAFKVTEGFVTRYGKERVRNTPLCESAIVGTTLGLSLQGYKAMMEMQFADFVTVGFNQIVNNLAKIHYRWGSTPMW